MFFSWLDDFDERDALMMISKRRAIPFALDSDLAFPELPRAGDIAEFQSIALNATQDPAYFDDPNPTPPIFTYDAETGFLRFPSQIETETIENNTAWAKVTDCGARDHVVVVFHHWCAEQRYTKFAKLLVNNGSSVVEMALPYHFERSPSERSYADYFVSPNLGRTIRSMRQATLDGRAIIHWLQGQGYKRISVLGISLGSWVAGLIAAHDKAVTKAAFLLSAGNGADVIWTGRTQQSVRQGIEQNISIADLQKAWAPINLENYSERLARADLDLHFVFGKRDRVILPELSERYAACLKKAGARLSIQRLNCGHASLSLLPFSLFAGWRIRRFFSR